MFLLLLHGLCEWTGGQYLMKSIMALPITGVQSPLAVRLKKDKKLEAELPMGSWFYENKM